jgi:hypothetical protein
MAGQQHNGMQCSEFDALLSQAIDGTLSGERLTAFEAHAAECKNCGPLLQGADAGRGWLKALEEVEPPPELVTNILLATTGVLPARERAAAQSWLGRVRELAWLIVSPIVAVARQPRFAMSFGMAFFTLSVSLSLAGVKLSDLRHIDLRPSAIRRTYYETSGRVVKYYENIRFVYEIESRVQQFKRATTAPPEERREPQNNNNQQRKENRDNSSGQPEQKQERNYAAGEGNLIYASLPDGRGTPVTNGATYRRFV